MSADWPVQEFEVRENWKCASVETRKARSPKVQRTEVVGHDDITWR
jgi:hypothetical protein